MQHFDISDVFLECYVFCFSLVSHRADYNQLQRVSVMITDYSMMIIGGLHDIAIKICSVVMC